jgi:hypothetical protein
VIRGPAARRKRCADRRDIVGRELRGRGRAGLALLGHHRAVLDLSGHDGRAIRGVGEPEEVPGFM